MMKKKQKLSAISPFNYTSASVCVCCVNTYTVKMSTFEVSSGKLMNVD